jgi:uncharacterized membrane protein
MKRALFWLAIFAALVIGPALLLAGCVVTRQWPG